MKSVILFGAGQTAEVMHCLLLAAGYTITAFCLDAAWCQQERLLDCPVVPFEQLTRFYAPDDHLMMIAVGYQNLNRLRAQRLSEAQAMGYEMLSYISPEASTWPGFSPGTHCRVGARSLIQPYARLGHNVSIGSGCIIGHHSEIQDHAFLASGVMLGGGVVIEPYAFVGTGAVIRNKARIASGSVIGSGAVILQDTQPNGVYMAAGAKALPLNSEDLLKD
jgi:sugar O-acyltransferase (sialic acid O-acetyltransferase NeuD family)